MPANGPVSLTRQTIFCFIPILDLYAAYHIKKLRWYLLIMISLGFVLSMVGNFVMPSELNNDPLYSSNGGDVDLSKFMLDSNSQVTLTFIIIDTVIAYAVAIYFIRKWSTKWNESFSYSN